MTHGSRVDWCVLAAIAVAIGALLLGASYWLDGPVLLVLMLWAYPQSYETTARGLAIRDALTRRLVPYEAITQVAPGRRGTLRIRHGAAGEVRIAPADCKGFLADLEARAPHLTRYRQELVLRDRLITFGYTSG